MSGLYQVLMLFSVIVFFFTGCRQHGVDNVAGGDTLTINAQLLTLVDFGDYAVADVKNPWDGDSLLVRYVLVKRDYKGDLPKGVVVSMPLRSSVIYSGVHGGVIDELGAVDAITGVTEGQYFSTASIREGLDEGSVVDVGNSASPSVEKIVELSPDAIILSAMQNQDLGVVTKMGIPLVQCADHAEPTPLGRAEWIKLFGYLYGAYSQADSIYNAVCADYNALKQTTSAVNHRPKVLTEQSLNGGVWYVPAGGSYMAQMLTDAGAYYPWASSEGTGSLTLDVASVFDTASDADFWLIRNFGALPLEALGRNNAMNTRFKAFANGGVYVCNTTESPLFDEFPFHPERLLRDYIAIFHSELLGEDSSPRYYQKSE